MWSGLRPSRRLLLLETQQLSAYLWRNGHITHEADFSSDLSGYEAFGIYLQQNPSSLFTLLAELAEEGFKHESIPRIHGSDRSKLIARRLAQSFYGLPYTTAISLGRESAGRQDERMLFAALTRPSQVEPWLEALQKAGSRLTAFHSAPILLTRLHKALGLESGRQIVLTLSQSGLRQTYFEKNELRFSHLTLHALNHANEIAFACIRESEKIRQYLLGENLITEAGPIDVVVLAHPEDLVLLRQKLHDSNDFNFKYLSLPEEARRMGLKSSLANSRCTSLLLHLLARSGSTNQLAPQAYRRTYRLFQFRRVLNAFALASLAGSLLFSAGALFNALALYEESTRIESSLSDDRHRYQTMLATLPTTPHKLEALRALVDRYIALGKRSPTLGSSLLPISLVLDEFPMIELEQIHWHLTDHPEAPASLANSPPSQPKLRQGFFSVIDLDATLPPSAGKDHRLLLSTAHAFQAALLKTSNIQAVITRLPFDNESGKTIRSSAEISSPAEPPSFSLRIVQRID